MNIYLVQRQDEIESWKDHFKSFVCIAKSSNKARQTYPCMQDDDSKYEVTWEDNDWVIRKDKFVSEYTTSTWIKAHKIHTLKITCIGTSELEPQVILSSFNAG